MRCCICAWPDSWLAQAIRLSSTVRACSRNHDIALVRSSLAPNLATAVHIGPEEMQATIGAIGKDVEVFDIVTHGGVLGNGRVQNRRLDRW